MRQWWQRVKAEWARRLGRNDQSESQEGRGAERDGGRRLQFDVGHLLHALQHANPDVRAGAALQLGRAAANHLHPGDAGSESAARIIQSLVDALDDDDAGVRSAAALSLGEWGAAAAGAVPALIDALAEGDDDVRSSAGIALQDIGAAARRPLEKALAHPDARIRAEAAAILSLMSREAERAW